MSMYTDILIDELDLATEGGYPLPVSDAASIGQDIKHAILESGYLTEMIAERNPQLRKALEQKVEMLAEDDQRIEPGTVVLQQLREPGQYMLIATTIHDGDFSVAFDTSTLFNPLYAEAASDRWPGVLDKTFGDWGEYYTEVFMPELWGNNG